jgi:hypothetical protein
MKAIPWGRILVSLILMASLYAISGCGGGGGGGGSAAAPNPAEGSTWDEMVWDQGKWG